MPEPVVPKDKAHLPRPPLFYPQRLANQKYENQFKKFIDTMKRLSINVPLMEALEQMPGYAKFIKDLDAKFVFDERCMQAFELLKHKLTTTTIISAPTWSFPFEIMCDASDVTVGAVLVQRVNKMFHPVYYASKTMNDAQVNYMVTKKEPLAIVFAMEKFWSYLMGEKIVEWKGRENQVADHLSRLEEEGRPCDGLEINDSFPDEQLLSVSANGMPWFADVVNFLVAGIIPCELSFKQRKKLKWDSLDFYWDELYLLKICMDGVIRSSSLYKDKMKYLHDKYTRGKEFKVGDLVLLFNSRLRLFPGKLKSKWSGPLEVVFVTPFGVLDLNNKNGEVFRVNEHRVKHYLGKIDDSHVVALLHVK
ncbi:uncharacterized protein [Nicotiana sylvestris]|uniref:uncharacterized protein n=1 Tax=Nicotiana sylvestris TaxID=4096 RepID=UPI00388CA7ED